VTQNEYLDLVRGVRSTTQHRQPEEMSKQPVEARDDHQTILPVARSVAAMKAWEIPEAACGSARTPVPAAIVEKIATPIVPPIS
jgi:hypothetical protein